MNRVTRTRVLHDEGQTSPSGKLQSPYSLAALTRFAQDICRETMWSMIRNERVISSNPDEDKEEPMGNVVVAAAGASLPVQLAQVERIHAKGGMNSKLLQNVLESMGLCDAHPRSPIQRPALIH